MNQRVIVRKYENRRLYDTSASRYINLEDIAKMVRDGADVQVVDARTGEDLTRSILTQIIVEDARSRESGLPLDFLRQMVIASGRAGHESVAAYLRAASQMYQSALGSVPGAANPFDLVGRLFPGAAAPPPKPPAQEDTSGIDDLRRRLDELEQKLAAEKTRRRGPRRK